jgi:hypothetical protein
MMRGRKAGNRIYVAYGTIDKIGNPTRYRFSCRIRRLSKRNGSFYNGSWWTRATVYNKHVTSPDDVEGMVKLIDHQIDIAIAADDAEANAKFYSLAVSQSDVSEALVNLACRKLYRSFSSSPEYYTRTFLPDVVAATVDNMTYVDASNLETIKELSAICKTILSALSVAKGNVGNFDDVVREARKSADGFVASLSSAKEIASTWLGVRFGARLTYRDVNEAVKAKLRQSRRGKNRFAHLTQRARITERYRALGKDVIESRTGVIYYHWYPESTGVANLWNYGLFPNFGQAWDLVPLSFVVDWVVGIQDALDDIDRMAYECLFRVEAFSTSHSWDITQVTSANSFPFKLTMRVYDRTISDRLPRVPVLLGEGHNRAINIIDAASIIVQRSR